MLLIWATAYIHPMCSSTRSCSPHTGWSQTWKTWKTCKTQGIWKYSENLRENSGKFELLCKKPGKRRENEKYVT